MPSNRPTITQARLKELLHYDPETGHFTWLVSNSNRAPAGSRAAPSGGTGYRQIRVDGRLYMTHRLAFLYMTGDFPPDDVDHINRIPSDNRWGNLRPATRRENLSNTALPRHNTSGHRGVSWNRRRGKWHACGKHGGRNIHLGYFADLEEAAAVADAWRKEHHGEFYSCPTNPETLPRSPNPEL